MKSYIYIPSCIRINCMKKKNRNNLLRIILTLNKNKYHGTSLDLVLIFIYPDLKCIKY